MRTCDEALELISAALDGQLSAEEQARLDEHLSRCSACGALYEDLRAIHAALEGDEVPAPAGFARRVMAAVAAEGGAEGLKAVPLTAKKRKAAPWKGWAAAAAVVAVVIWGAVTLPGQFRMGGDSAASTGSSGAASGGAADAGTAAMQDAAAPAAGAGTAFSQRESGTEDYGELTDGAAPESPEAEAARATTADAAQAEEAFDTLAVPSSAPAKVALDGDLDSHCGVLTLTEGPLPTELEGLESAVDDAGRVTYLLPAGEFFTLAESLEAGKTAGGASFTLEEGDPDADYGLVIVEP